MMHRTVTSTVFFLQTTSVSRHRYFCSPITFLSTEHHNRGAYGSCFSTMCFLLLVKIDTFMTDQSITMDKQQELLSTALRLFTEAGFHGTPTSRIAKEASVANGTLFHYYPTKEALILALYKLLLIRRNDFLGNMRGEEPEEDLKLYYFKILDWAAQYPEEFRFLQMFKHSPYASLIASEDDERLNSFRPFFKTRRHIPVPPELIWRLFDHQVEAMIEYLDLIKAGDMERKKLIADSFSLFRKMIS